MRPSVTIRAIYVALISLVFATVLSAWGQTPTATAVTTPAVPALPAPNDTPAAPAAPSLLTIGGGDLLKITVLGAPESDQQVRVDVEGNATLNFIGSVHLAGLTPTAAQELIGKKLADGGYFRQPQVSVFTMEYATQGVSVLGEVTKPGVYPLLGPRRLFDVISMAGGTTPKAGKIISITRREHPDTPHSYTMTNDANEVAKINVEILPGDTVMVSRAGVVYVVGDVHKPSGVIMDNGSEMTVLQAIAMAEGTNPTAALNKSKLIRRTPQGPQEFPLALKDMLASKAPDMHLQAEDIIFVPGSAAKGAARRSMEAIIQAAVGVAVYGAR